MVLGMLDVNIDKKHNSFPKGSGTRHFKRHYPKSHLPNQPQQIQISTYGDNIRTFIYNIATCRDNLSIYIVQAKQPFSMAKDLKNILKEHNHEFKKVSRSTCKFDIYKIYEE